MAKAAKVKESHGLEFLDFPHQANNSWVSSLGFTGVNQVQWPQLSKVQHLLLNG